MTSLTSLCLTLAIVGQADSEAELKAILHPFYVRKRRPISST